MKGLIILLVIVAIIAVVAAVIWYVNHQIEVKSGVRRSDYKRMQEERNLAREGLNAVKQAAKTTPQIEDIDTFFAEQVKTALDRYDTERTTLERKYDR